MFCLGNPRKFIALNNPLRCFNWRGFKARLTQKSFCKQMHDAIKDSEETATAFTVGQTSHIKLEKEARIRGLARWL